MLCIDDVSYIYATIPLKKNPSKKKKKSQQEKSIHITNGRIYKKFF